jgi:hypothetical protein
MSKSRRPFVTATSRPITCNVQPVSAARFRCALAAYPFVQDRRSRRSGFVTGLLAGLIDRRVWSQLFEPHLVIVVQAPLIIVDQECSTYQ